MEEKLVKKRIKEAIHHFEYGISYDVFSEPVTSYAKLAIEALKKELDEICSQPKSEYDCCRPKAINFCKYCGSNFIQPFPDENFKCYECGGIF
ncbi:MAG: hypothetical protein WC939_06000 [Acholeplasmataceae bacterium]